MKKAPILLLLALLAFGPMAWAQFSGGTGTAEDPYLISSKADWNALHNQVKNGNLYTGKFFKMTADIGTVTTPIGYTSDYDNKEGNFFEGTFDGNGHILTVNFRFNAKENIGVFCRLNNATIKNLHVTGKADLGEDIFCRHYGGLAGRTAGNTSIIACRSSVNIYSDGNVITQDGDDGEAYYFGGFVGTHMSGTLLIVNCLFDGKFHLRATNYAGGFVGQRKDGKISLVNCLSAAKKFDDDFWSDHSSTFVSGGDGDNVAMYHCIFTKKCGDDKDGVDARDWTGYFVFNYLGGYNGGWDWDLLDEVFPMYNHDIDLSPYLFSGSGTETSPYLIQNANDWEGLVRNIYLWRTYSGKHFKLTNDITLSESLASEHSTMLGVTKHASFQGIFDGNGHTITVNYTDNGDEHYCGPFRYINGATIKNLHVTGTIYKEKKKHIGGLVGKAYGTNRIINCRSSVDIQANTDGDGSHGGFLGDLRDGTTTFISCLFDGKLQGTRTKKWGGFVGWVADGKQANFINCVFNPQQVNVKDDGNRTFARRNDGDDVSFTNCYYFQTLGSAQGKEACSISADEHVTMTPYGTEEPGVSGGITSYLILHDYNPCVMYGGVLYSSNGDQVKLNLSLNGEPVEDYSTDHFIASAGTINSSTNPRTLTMPNENVTISLAPTALNLCYGDINDPFLIYTFEQWKEMCSHINNGESVPNIGGYYSEKYYKLMADITITETHSSGNSAVMVGISSSDHTKFCGTFDGNGHTITLAIADTSSDDYCAPFRYLKNGTIKNLHVAGTIVKTNKKNAGGLVGKAEGQNQIKNCRSSVDIRFSKNGDVSSGGFVGELRDGSNNSTEFYNCLFDGELYGTDAYCWGGFVGWVADDCWARFSKCFFNPTDVNFDINDGNDNSKTFARFNSGDGTVIVNSCYYTTLINDAQGSTNANGIDNEQLRFNLGHGWEIVTENSVAKVVPIMKKYSLSGEGTEASPYLITSTDDWNGLAGNVYLGETYSDEFLQLTDNITVNRMIGTGTTSTLWDDYSFSGTFDGAGNTLTFDYSTNVGNEGLIAPFRFVDGATIKNLVVDGTIVAANKYAAGIIGRVDGNTALTNCRSSVTINSSVAGEGYHGGLIGLIRSGYSATITGCIFDGKLLGGSTTHCGGLVGLAFSDETDSATVNIINSLYAPAEPTESEIWINATGSSTMARCTNNGQATITNSYYMQTLGTAQGKQARTISGGENVIVENAGTATEYDVSGITSYGTGIGLTSIVLSEGEEEDVVEEVEEKEVEEVEVVVLYAGNGDGVDLDLSVEPEYNLVGNFYANNGNASLSGDHNPYLLTMPDENVIITADLAPVITLDVVGYGNSDGGYVLIASPVGTVSPENVTNMLENDFDLYAFDQSQDLEWRNYKANTFDLEPGKGYLYANSEDVTLVFPGIPYNNNGEITLSKTTGAEWEGWNLVGNPYNEMAYIEDGRDFYTMNAEGSEIMASTSNSIEAMEGVFVIAESDSETIVFTTTEPENNDGKGLVLNLSKERSGVIDRAIVRLSEGASDQKGSLPKFQLRENSTKVYIPQDGTDYAVVNVGRDAMHRVSTEIPVNFKASENGTYTLSIACDDLVIARSGATWQSNTIITGMFTYLHLIDNLTGIDIDLLQTPSYTFEAKTTDYASRFKLVFATEDATNQNNDVNFAYISNGEIIVNGTGTIQMIDLLGHVLYTGEVNSAFRIPHSAFSSGVYVLRLVNGADIKTQKIVIK